jgi:hypothetical protein
MSNSRERFEADAEPYGYILTESRCDCCTYLSVATEHRFQGWQSATEQSAKEPTDLRQQLAAEQALVKVKDDALHTAIDLIQLLDGQDNSCAPRRDISLLRAATCVNSSPDALYTEVNGAEIKVLEEAMNVWVECFSGGYTLNFQVVGWFRNFIKQRKGKVK